VAAIGEPPEAGIVLTEVPGNNDDILGQSLPRTGKRAVDQVVPITGIIVVSTFFSTSRF